MRHLLLAVLISMAAVLAGAQQLNLPPGQWWENERLAEHIGLTDDQRGSIRDLVYEHAHRMIDLRAAVEKSELELAGLVRDPEFTDAAARSAFGGLVTARTALEKERFEMLLAVRGVLTSEQWVKIQEMRERLRRNRDRPEGERPRWREAPPPGG
jgi:Spy/CpxP family protein refolding chaperone